MKHELLASIQEAKKYNNLGLDISFLQRECRNLLNKEILSQINDIVHQMNRCEIMCKHRNNLEEAKTLLNSPRFVETIIEMRQNFEINFILDDILIRNKNSLFSFYKNWEEAKRMIHAPVA